MVATHYQRLGVAPSASTEEIRAAYRQLARRLHPDRLGDTTGPERDHAERRMREINESWEVLGDPARRRRYDEGRVEGRRHTTATTATPRTAVAKADDDLVDVLPPLSNLGAGALRHGPWLALVAVFLLIFVLSAYAGSKKDPPAPTARDLRAGDCLDTPVGTQVSIVPCDGAHEYQVAIQVVDAGSCPPGTEALRLADDGLWDCVYAS